MSLILEVLDKKKHDLKSFDCSVKEMNDFLRQFAFKNQKLMISNSWVMSDDNDKKIKKTVIGYFTLTSCTIEPHLLTEEIKLPKYPIPMTLLARFAIDTKFQGQNLGIKLFYLALQTALELSYEGLSTYAVILEALNDEVLAFYNKFTFLKKIDGSNKQLFVPMKVIEKILKA